MRKRERKDFERCYSLGQGATSAVDLSRIAVEWVGGWMDRWSGYPRVLDAPGCCASLVSAGVLRPIAHNNTMAKTCGPSPFGNGSFWVQRTY